MELISISDLITNSSSEVFCYITSPDNDVLNEIYKEINKLFGYNQEAEITPTVDLDEEHIVIELPYSLENCQSFFKAGLKALLEHNHKNYKIEFV